MSSVVRVCCGAVMTLACLLTSAAWGAENEQLQKAIALFDRQEYVAAQEALLGVDREKLTDDERTRLDGLLTEVKQAIAGSEKAAQDMTAADAAYQAGEWDAADSHYHAVLNNPYATAAVREQATAQRARIVEKKKLADAARPTGAVEEKAPAEETVVVERTVTTEETVTPAGAPAAAAPADQAAPATEEPAAHRLTPADQLRMRDALLWQRAVAQAQALITKSRAALAASEFAEARQSADTALQTIEAAARYAEPAAKYQTAKDEIVLLKQDIERASEEFSRARAAEQREQIGVRLGERRRLLEQQKNEKVQQLFNSAEQLRREQRFAEAVEVLREIMRIDPGNAKARYQLEVAEDYESISDQSRWQRDVYSESRRALLIAEEALIPWDRDILYPGNWQELTARRAKHATTTMMPEDQELNRRLDEVLPEVRFDDQPLDQALGFLQETTQVNMAIDWEDLAASMIARDKPVSLHLTNMKFRTVLKQLLAQAGGEVDVAFRVADGLLRVATRNKLDRDKFVLIYDIRDLILNIPQAKPVSSLDGGVVAADKSPVFANVAGPSLFSPGGDNAASERQSSNPADSPIEKIKDIVRQTVEPNSWRETGGGEASIRDLNGQLIVYHTSEAHEQVTGLLDQLRKTTALQISVESRFLDVVSNFLEQFGVDIDFVFNSGSAGYDYAPGVTDPNTGAPVLMPRQYSRIGSIAATPQFGQPLAQASPTAQPYGNAAFVPQRGGILPTSDEMTPISVGQNSFSLTDPAKLNTGVPGSWGGSPLNPAMSIAGSFLDNLQVDFLIRATQANQRSSIVQAPRLVLFNGQRSRIQVGRRRSYIGSLQPRLADSAVGFATPPTPNNADSGVEMNVEGTISADKRYVTLSIIVNQLGEPSFEKFELQRASGNSPGAFVMLPDFTFATLETTVSVPDGGTVLLGGLKQVGEREVEAGVPMLSKIPILKRAFTNQTSVKDIRTLLILVKSKIVILEEAEEEAFPSFSRN